MASLLLCAVLCSMRSAYIAMQNAQATSYIRTACLSVRLSVCLTLTLRQRRMNTGSALFSHRVAQGLQFCETKYNTVFHRDTLFLRAVNKTGTAKKRRFSTFSSQYFRNSMGDTTQVTIGHEVAYELSIGIIQMRLNGRKALLYSISFIFGSRCVKVNKDSKEDSSGLQISASDRAQIRTCHTLKGMNCVKSAIVGLCANNVVINESRISSYAVFTLTLNFIITVVKR